LYALLVERVRVCKPMELDASFIVAKFDLHCFVSVERNAVQKYLVSLLLSVHCKAQYNWYVSA